VAVEPLETEAGRKRRINQSACNKDYSCFKGFCPSFVSLRGASLRKSLASSDADVSALPEPALPQIERAWNLALAGIGGTGVLTISAILGMAAHVDGKIPMVLDMAGLAQKGGAVMSHVRISRPDRPVAAPRIAAGSADLVLAADAVVAASKDCILLCSPERTQAVLNTRLTPVSDFIRKREFDFKADKTEASIAAAVRTTEHFLNFSALAARLTGDEIGANLMLLGYAWQRGMVPLAGASIREAIRLNGVSVKANTQAFNWGRLLADDPARVAALAGFDDRPAPPPTLEALVAARSAHLTAYQDARLAARYADRVARIAAVAGPGSALTRIVAETYARVLAYKDEYEVARLYSLPAFRAGIAAEFTGDFRLSLYLAPPILSRKAPDDRPAKREFGRWILPVLGVLARLKGLRGTWADPFGYGEDRKLERKLIADYEADLDLAERCLETGPVPLITELLALPQEIRGFGPVKKTAYIKQMARREILRAQILDGNMAAVGAAA
jgi:indolepyruvate ferredoxin oxidoreductase